MDDIRRPILADPAPPTTNASNRLYVVFVVIHTTNTTHYKYKNHPIPLDFRLKTACMLYVVITTNTTYNYERGDMAITKDAIFEAANTIKANGSSPTLAAVRTLVGGGSFTTISEALKEWKGQTPTLSPIKEAAPEAITGQLATFGRELWATAMNLANERLDTERASMEARRAELEAQRREAAELADQLAAELDAERAQALTTSALMAKLQSQIDEARTLATQAQSDSKAKTVQLKEVAARVDDAKATIEREAAAHATAIASEQSGHEQTRKTLQTAQTDLATASADLKAAREKIQAAEAQRGLDKVEAGAVASSLRIQIQDAQKIAERERAAASAAKESLANLQGQLSAFQSKTPPTAATKPAKVIVAAVGGDQDVQKTKSPAIDAEAEEIASRPRP